MDGNKQNSRERQLSEAVCKAFEQLIRNIENEPGLILEGESQSADREDTLKDIRSWLFKRGDEKGDTGS